jgi:hypothetical protein
MPGGERHGGEIPARPRLDFAGPLDIWWEPVESNIALWECPGRPGRGATRKEALMTPALGIWPQSSPVRAASRHAEPGKGTRVPARTAAPRSTAPSPGSFELQCAELHPVHCDVQLRAASAEHLLICACEHGAYAHGFTPAWYSAERLAAMTEIVARRTS